MSRKIDIATHVMILGWFNLVASAIFAFLACFALVFFLVIGAAMGEPDAQPILSVIGCAAFVLLGFFAVPGIFAGWGLLARKPWGRIAGIVVGILDLFNIPVGTAFGIYALWVLSDPEAEAYFGGRSEPTAGFRAESPPPPQ